MTWAKLDDQFPDHPKVMRAGPEAAWLHVCAICYCARHLTDGIIPKEALPHLSTLPEPGRLAARLVDVGLWHERSSDYEVHDYLAYNPSREAVIGEREKAKQRRASVARTSGDDPVPRPVPDVPSEHTDRFEEFWAVYPTRRGGRKNALRAWIARRREGVHPEDLVSAARNYSDHCRREALEDRYRMHGATFLGPSERFVEYAKTVALPELTPVPTTPGPLPYCKSCSRLTIDCKCGVELADVRRFGGGSA